jgi:hypothetical protein
VTSASTRLRFLAFVVAVSVAAALVVAAIGGRTASAENPQPPVTPNVQPSITANASLKNSLGVLARPGASTDLLPPSLSHISPFFVSRYGITPDSARKVGPHAWLIPGSSGACLMEDYGDEGIAGGCGDTASVLADGLAGTTTFSKPARTVQVSAVIPDGATSVKVHVAGGGIADATASTNFVGMTVQGDPSSLSYTGADGSTHEVPLGGGHSNASPGG